MPNYKNRIIGSGEEQLDQIMFNPRNWRIHPMHQQNALKGVLEEIGWVQQVIINKRTGNLIDGHLRCQLAAREGNETIPVVYVDLSEEEEALVLSTLDPIAGMAVTDKEKLDDLFRQFNSDNENVQKLISEIAEKEKLEFGKKDIEDVEPQIDRAEELRVKRGVQTGQMWKLGEHKIICGDCTDKAVVDKLMDGQKANMIFTDPPWNVAIGLDSNPRHRQRDGLQNDNMTDVEYSAFVSAFVSACDGDVYCVLASEYLDVLAQEMRKQGFHWSAFVIWVKDIFVLGRSKYQRRYEPIWYGWHTNSKSTFCDKRDLDDVWEIPRPKRSEEHPTMKPIELVARAINNSSKVGDIIFEPFCGSGTDILACERLSRKCRAIEISPAYVAVSIQRWVDATGGTPELMDNLDGGRHG